MSKKHFEALAAALKDSKPWRSYDIPTGKLIAGKDEYEQWYKDTIIITDVCARFNPNFDRARFLAACGVEG